MKNLIFSWTFLYGVLIGLLLTLVGKLMKNGRYSTNQIMKFLIPSVIGAVVFLMPIPAPNGINTILGVAIDQGKAIFKPYLPWIAMGLVVFFINCFTVGINRKTEENCRKRLLERPSYSDPLLEPFTYCRSNIVYNDCFQSRSRMDLVHG